MAALQLPEYCYHLITMHLFDHRRFEHSKKAQPSNNSESSTAGSNNTGGAPDRDVMCLVFPDGSVRTVKPDSKQR